MGIGAYSLITSIGVQQIDVDDTFAIGESTSYKFSAPIGSKHFLNMTADSFKVDLDSPGDGLRLDEKDFKNELSIEWVHLEDGESRLRIDNTGNSELKVSGYVNVLLDPIQMTYHVLVIIAGVIIIGFSAGFSIRKPRGF